MARAILSDITNEFKTEVPECGSSLKCYCITCTRKRGYTWRLFAAWRQAARNSNCDPASIKLYTFATQYATSVLEYNEVVVVVQAIGNCNGEYAAGITAQIMEYCNPPTVQAVAIEYMSCNIKHPLWTGDAHVLTFWYDHLQLGVNRYRWVYLRRKTLFRYFTESHTEAVMPDIKKKFLLLRNTVPAMENGKYKNKLYILMHRAVKVADSKIIVDLTVNDVFDPNGGRIGVWNQYWGFYEQAFGL